MPTSACSAARSVTRPASLAAKRPRRATTPVRHTLVRPTRGVPMPEIADAALLAPTEPGARSAVAPAARAAPVPAAYAVPAPSAAPVAVGPVAVGPVAVGPVAVGPVAVGPVTVGP